MSAEKITLPEKMKPYLFQLEKSKARIELFFDKNKVPGGSMLLTTVVEKKRRELIIDELIPLALNKQIGKSEKIVVRGMIEGCSLTFATRYLRSLDYQGSPAHALALPEAITYNQLREYFRVPALGVHNRVELLLVDADKETLLAEGNLFDISKGGVSVEFQNVELSTATQDKEHSRPPENAVSVEFQDLDLTITPADKVLLRLEFTDEDIAESAGSRSGPVVFKVPVVVKSERLLKAAHKKRLGFMFTDVNMNSHEMVELGKVVFAIQRRILRNKAD